MVGLGTGTAALRDDGHIDTQDTPRTDHQQPRSGIGAAAVLGVDDDLDRFGRERLLGPDEAAGQNKIEDEGCK